MISRAEVKRTLNANWQSFGVRGPTINPLQVEPSSVTNDMVVIAGINHGCPVIDTVLARPATPAENLTSYGLKNDAFNAFDDLFLATGRLDLSSQWNHGELRRKQEKTHPSLKLLTPDQLNQRQLVPKARIPQMDLCDFIKVAQLSVPDRQFSVSDFTQDSVDATDIYDFCSSVALRAALTLADRGVDNQTIATVLSNSFAKSGLIKEYGQQKPSERLVNDIVRKIVRSGQLPGLASEFKKMARPKVK